ncbi:DNA-dependent protein kinase catalytic subunit-like [Lycorma delicatula]|uniref:DNA-dependent protein kinase catalytic subunit-like n=1 Tax=Lycorma delicatula TaxID=130591 RepID=UPI003F5126E8
MEIQIRDRLRILNSEEITGGVAVTEISSLKELFNSVNSTFDRDLIISQLFDETVGILVFINNAVKNCCLENGVKEALEFLNTLCQEFSDNAAHHLEKIVEAAKNCVVSVSTKSAVKAASLDIITIVLQKFNHFDASSILLSIIKLLSWGKNNAEVTRAMFKLVGVICEIHSTEVFNYDKECSERNANHIPIMNQFMEDVCNELRKSVGVDGVIKKSVLEGCFDALNGILVQHVPSDMRFIYNQIKTVLLLKDENRRVHQRSALKMVERHARLISSNMRIEYNWWHETLWKWVKDSNPDDKKAGYNTYVVFMIEMARLLAEDPKDDDGKLLRFFVKYFTTCLQNPNQSLDEEFNIAVKGIGEFASVFNKFMEQKDLDAIFVNILQRTQYMCNNNQSIEQVPVCLEMLSKIICNLQGNVSEQQFTAMEHLVVFVVENFPLISTRLQHHAIKSVAINIFSIALTNGGTDEFKKYLDVLVYQGLIRTCKHPIPLDFEDGNGITVNNYVNFWKELLDPRHISWEDELKSRVIRQLLDTFLHNVLVLLNKLDVSLKRKDDEDCEGMSNPEDVLEPNNKMDFAIAFNIKKLCSTVLPHISEKLDSQLFSLLNNVISLSSRNPLVCPFYDLLTTLLKISESVNLFKDENFEDNDECKRNIVNYLEDILSNLHQYQTSLQVSCLKVVIATPVVVIEELLTYLPPAFKVVFQIGYGQLDLAKHGIEALERWIGELTTEQLKPLISNIIPQLYPFLHTRRLITHVLFDETTEKLPSKRSQRSKIITRLKKSNISETELSDLQKRILLFLGRLDTPLLLSLLNQDHTDSVIVWNSTPVLSIEVKFPDMKKCPIIYLDTFASRIMELALTSSDRKTRAASYEALQAIFVIFLGQTTSKRVTLESAVEFMKKLLPGLFQLACSTDSIAKQMFSQLLLETCHWYSSTHCLPDYQLSYVHEFVKAIFNALTHTSDNSVRDFGAKCLREFISWAKEQLEENHLEKYRLKVESVIKTLNTYCLHPCQFKREGAALAFNSMYAILRRNANIVTVFWLEMLYCYTKSLTLSVNNKHGKEALTHICRVLVEKAELFNKENSSRRKPPEFEGTLLKDAVSWLLTQCSSINADCQQKCMELVKSIAPCVAGYGSIKEFLDSFINDRKEGKKENLVSLFEGGGKQEILADRPCANIEGIIVWLNHVYATITFYTWLLQENCSICDIIQSSESRFVAAFQYFVGEVSSYSAGKLVEEVGGTSTPVSLTIRQTDQFTTLKCRLSLAAFQFIIEVQNDSNFLPQSFWNDEFWIWLMRCIITPPLVGFDNLNIRYKKKLDELLPSLILSIQNHHDSNFFNMFLKNISKGLQEKQLDVLKILGDKPEIDGGRNVILQTLTHVINGGYHRTSVHEQYINALLFLKKCELLANLGDDVWDCDGWCISEVVQEVFKATTCEMYEKTAEINSIKNYLTSVLSFVFQLDSDVEACMICIFNREKPQTKKSICEPTKGKYFLSLFSDELMNHLLNNIEGTVSYLTSNKLFVSDRVDLLVINRLLQKAKECNEETKEKLADVLLLKWFPDFFNREISSLKRDEFLTVILNIISLLPNHNVRIYKEGLCTEIVNFLFQELQRANNDLNYKTLILEALPALVNPGNDNFDEELWNVLSVFSDNNFPLSSSNYALGSHERIAYSHAFTALLRALKETGDCTILKIVIRQAAGDADHPCFNDIQSTLCDFKRFNVNIQLNAVNLSYEIYKRARGKKKLPIVKDFLIPLLNVSNTETVLKFYENVIVELYSVCQDFSVSSEKEERYATKAGAYVLIDTLFSRIPKDFFCDENNVLWIKLNQFYPDIQKILSHRFIKCAHKEKGERLEDLSEECEDVKSLYYLYHQAAYNSLIVMISNTFSDEDLNNGKGKELCKKCIFNSSDFIWKRIVCCDYKYKFTMDFDEIPKRRKQLIGIRRAVRNEREAGSVSSSTATFPSYSQALFRSTLDEDLSKFDFSGSVVRDTHETNFLNENLDSTEVSLEADDLNNHECMAPLFALIFHLSKISTKDFGEQQGSSEGKQQEINMPSWLEESLRGILKKNQGILQKKNICLFILKLIMNCQTLLKKYAKSWISPIIQIILDKCAGSDINYIIADAVKMIVSWANIAGKPENSEDISNLLSFLFNKTPSDRKDLFKYNVEILRDVVEVWKCYIQVPHDDIFDKLSSGNKYDVEAAIEMTAILLFHDIQPFSESNKESFFEYLFKHILESETGNRSAEVIGLLFKFLTKNGTCNLSEEDEKFHSRVLSLLKKNPDKSKDLTRVIYSVHYIQRYYRPIVKCFSKFALCWLGKVHSKIRFYVLEIILIALDYDLQEVSHQLLIQDSLIKILKHPCVESQLLVLKIIHKLLPTLTDKDAYINQLEDVVYKVIEVMAENNNVECRGIFYDILIWTYENSSPAALQNLHEKVRIQLLKSLNNSNDDLKHKILLFWRDKQHLQTELFSRMSDLFTKLYSSESELNFIDYAASFLLDICFLSSDCKDKLFKEPLSECKMEEMKIDTSWRHSSTVNFPAFAKTLPSQMGSLDVMPSTSLSTSLTERKSLTFEPTPGQVKYHGIMSQRLLQKEYIPVIELYLIIFLYCHLIDTASSYNQSSFGGSSLVSLSYGQSRYASSSTYDGLSRSSYNVSSPSTSGIHEHKFVAPSSQRFLKHNTQARKRYAEIQIRRNEGLHSDLVRKKQKLEKDVSLTRTYRKGDFPDIEITFEAVLKHLQDLAERDSVFAGQLMVSLVESVLKNMEKDTKVLIENLNKSFYNILLKTKTPVVVSTIFEIAFRFNDLFKLDSVQITEVSKNCGLLNSGALLLEDKLNQYNNSIEPSPSKKSKTSAESSDKALWAQLSQIYRSMGEDDIVQGIFEEKLASVNVRRALENEAAGNLKTAKMQYSDLLKDETIQNEPQKDFLFEAFFKCLVKMADWGSLNKLIKEEVDNNTDVLWQRSWYKEFLLPWFFTSSLHCFFENDESCKEFIGQSLKNWLSDEEKLEHVKTHFGEQLALFYYIMKNKEMARVTSNQNITYFLEDWAQLPPLAHSLIVKKCFQLQTLMEVHSFLLIPTPQVGSERQKVFKWSNSIEDLLNKWENNSPSPYDSLIFWETRTKYRTYFCSQLKNCTESLNEKILKEKICKTDQNMLFSLINCALSQQNYYVTRKVMMNNKIKLTNGNSELWYLSKSKNRLLLARRTEDIFQHFKTAITAWKDINRIENSKDLSLKLSWHCHITEICKDIFSWIKQNPIQWSELGNYHHEEKVWLLEKTLLQNCDRPEIVIEHLYRIGLQNLQEATKIVNEFCALRAKTELQQQKYLSETAETYLTLAKYCMKHQRVDDNVEYDKILIESLLRSMHHGSAEARQLFPCLLILPAIATTHKDVFISESESVPEWMFLSWVNQLLASLDDYGNALFPLLIRMAKIYPAALQIPFHLSCSNYKNKNTRQFVEQLKVLLAYDLPTEKLLSALQYVTLPGTILLHHIKKVIKSIKHNCSDQILESKWEELFENSFKSEHNEYKSNLQKDIEGKYENELKNIHYCMKQEDKQKVTDKLKKLFDNIQKQLKISQKYNKINLELESMCPFLVNFNGMNCDIEIPGQYTGDSKPLPNLHIKISQFSEYVKQFESIRRPIKIGIVGHDGNERGFLVKYGEDLRQDQRILQLMKLMNQILMKDNFIERNLNIIGTYSVVPITSNLGLISWIDNTKPIKDFMKSSLTKEEENTYDRQYKQHISWLEKKCPTGKNQFGELIILAYLNYGYNETVSEFCKMCNSVPDDILRRSIQKLSQSMVVFHYLRSQLGSSLAVMNICHWVLGIGDRHLSNSLIRTTDGHLFGIDFGHAFGSATQYLEVPELMPFRLTPKILNLFSPFKETGLIRETMVRCLTCLSKHKHILMAVMNVFVQEPSLNWLEIMLEKAEEHGKDTTGNENWLPDEKVNFVRSKLTGANPMNIMLKELTAGHQSKSKIFHKMSEVLKGDKTSIRSTNPEDGLSPKQQVACLIEQATDQHILGKTYIGWEPWI